MSFWKTYGRSKNLFLILALGLAFLAQYLFTGEFLTRDLDSDWWIWQPRYTLASALLLAALGCAIYAFARRNDEKSFAASPTEKSQLTDLDFNALVLGGLCYVSALMIYWTLGEGWLVQLLWVAGIVGLIALLWWQSRMSRDEYSLTWWEWALVIGVTGLAFGLRYWQLTEIPNQIDQDIPLMGSFAGQLIETNNYNWIGFSGSAHLLSYDQSLAWSMRLFGYNHYGLVMKSVLLGTLTVPLLFLLAREMFDWRVGLIAALLLAGNYTHIHFSRLLFGPSATFFAVLAFYCIFRGLRVQQKFWFGLGGVSMGIGLLLYDSARVVPVLLIGLILWRAIWYWRTFRNNFSKWIVFIAGVLVGFGPMMGFVFANSDQVWGRGNSVMLWTPEVWRHSVDKYQTDSVIGVVFGQIRSTFLALHLYGDGSPHFAFPRPMVSALTAALFVIGVGYCLWRIRDIRHFALISWVLATFVLGGVLTYDPPYWPHLNIALPAIAIVAAVAMVVIVDRLSAPHSPIRNWALRITVIVALVFTRFDNWDTYYGFVVDNADPSVLAARYIGTLPADTQVYVVSEQVDWHSYVFRFLNRGVTGQNIRAESIRDLSPALGSPAVFLVFDDPHLIATLQQQYADGKVEEHSNSEDRLIFTSYYFEPASYVSPPPTAPFNPLSLPGWWLVFGLLGGTLAWFGVMAWTRRVATPKVAGTN